MHNLPEQGNDEEIVGTMVAAANLTGIDDIVLKREKPKDGRWSRPSYLPWKKMKQRPNLLKLKMTIRKGCVLSKGDIIEQIQNTVLCKAFNIQVTPTVEM